MRDDETRDGAAALRGVASDLDDVRMDVEGAAGLMLDLACDQAHDDGMDGPLRFVWVALDGEARRLAGLCERIDAACAEAAS